MKPEDLLVSLADSIGAGVPPLVFARSPALETLPADLSRRLVRGLESGQPLSSTLASLEVLPPASIAIIRAAEAHGDLPGGLRLVAERLAQGRRDSGRMLLALAYPAFLLLFAATILPLPALFKEGVGAWASASLPLVAAVLAAVVLVAILLRHRAPFAARARRSLSLWLPLVRASARHRAFADFADVLGACLRAGVPMRAALPLAADASEHPSITGTGPALVARLDAGATLVETLRAIPRFPPGLLGQVHAAEHAGKLDEALVRVAATCRSKSRSAIV
ncbi:MAG: type II secretion system F family protein, partial [Deltaproteobacteria bacterium]|nr:type II secretion system F family protein [Deltaproteobacteria bacterium]